MSLRIGEFVVAGEIINRTRNSIVGWLGLDEERGIKLELTGNLPAELAGRHFRFEVQREHQPIMDEAEFKQLHIPQIGAPGEIALRVGHGRQSDLVERLISGTLRGPLPNTESLCLYLEWFSQDGQIVAEIINPQIEFVTEEESDSESQSTPELEIDQEGTADADVSDLDLANADDDDPLELSPDDEDEYELFKPGLAEAIRRSSGDDDFDPDEESFDDSDAFDDETPNAATGEPKRREWDEVIPGLDPETKRMYDQWDEIVEGTRDEPLSTMFDPPIELPPLEQVTSEPIARSLVTTLLARLALHGVAIDVCEHYSYVDVYRYLMTEVLPVANIHPNLPASGWVQHYSTWESCPDCEREFDEKDRAENAENPPDADED